MRLNRSLTVKILKVCYDHPIEDFPLTEKAFKFSGYSLAEIAEHCRYLYEEHYIRSFDTYQENPYDGKNEYSPDHFQVGHLTWKGQETCENYENRM